MSKIVKITRNQLKRAVVNEVQEMKLRGIVRSVLVEAGSKSKKGASPPKSTAHNWDYFVHMTASAVTSANESDGGWEESELASDVFRPSSDKEVREMRNDAHSTEETPAIDAAIAKYATEFGLDEEELREAFFGGLDATEEYMSDDDPECEDCMGSGDCSECSQDGTDTNTGETCENCGGTHECPTCQGSGDAN